MLLEEINKLIDRKKMAVGAGVCAILVIGAGSFAHLLSPIEEWSPRQILFEVRPGDGYRNIISSLGSRGLIRSKAAFTVFSFFTGSVMRLKPGLYRLNSGMSSYEILSKLIKGTRIEVSVTVVEGYSMYDIDRLLADAGVLQEGELVEVGEKRFLEGKLFPDTYRFFKDSRVDEVVDKFLETFSSKTEQVLVGSATSSDLNLILASLIEKEVPDFEDRKIISGILKKRFEAGIPLQVDATICYIKEAELYPEVSSCYPLTPLDFKKESPYNTYLHVGVPPGPIGNPGISAVVAALHPKSSPYWYYLSDPATGKTIFSRELDEQERNRVKYLRKRD